MEFKPLDLQSMADAAYHSFLTWEAALEGRLNFTFTSPETAMRDSYMKPVIAVEKLLKTVRANRERHIAILTEAQQAFVMKASEHLGHVADKVISDYKEGKVNGVHVNLTPPSDHTREYDEAIEMLTWTQEEVVTLTAHDFRRLVLDEFEWQEGFLKANMPLSGVATSYAADKGWD